MIDKLIQFVYLESNYLDNEHLRVVLDMVYQNMVGLWRSVPDEVDKIKPLKGVKDLLSSIVVCLLAILALTKYIQDIVGGIVATCPSSKDYPNSEVHDLLEKYLGGKEGIPTEHRRRMAKLLRALTFSYEDVLSIHAEGSLEAQKMSIMVLGDFARYRASAMRAARIKNPKPHPLFEALPEFPPQL